jgi:hypothetical protein
MGRYNSKRKESKDAIYRGVKCALEKISGTALIQFKDKDKKEIDYAATVQVMQSTAAITLDLMEEVEE